MGAGCPSRHEGPGGQERGVPQCNLRRSNNCRLERGLGGFPGDSDGKESTCNAGDPGSIPRVGRSPGGGHGNLLQYSCLENPYGQRSLAGYSPWGRTESDTTEGLDWTEPLHTLLPPTDAVPSDRVLPRPFLAAWCVRKLGGFQDSFPGSPSLTRAVKGCRLSIPTESGTNSLGSGNLCTPFPRPRRHEGCPSSDPTAHATPGSGAAFGQQRLG